jgi:midasin (ATPase involved in ribosome maturation)
MAVDFKTFLSVVPFVTDVNKPVLIRGRHGIGKSELVYAFAAAKNMPVVERRASQMTEGDLIGLPSLEGNSTKWNPPDWFKRACDYACVVFLDEVDRATIEVRQGIFELTDSRKLNGHHLHPDTLIFAAVNGGIHGAQYQVSEMDPAELDRWTVFDVEPSVDDWLSWAKNNVNGIVWDFINQNRGHLEHKGENEPNKVYPSRRSWVRYNECLTKAKMLDSDIKPNLPSVYELGCAFIGLEGAVAFRDFADKYDRQVTIEDIFEGRLDKVKGWSINDHVAMIDKMQANGALKVKLNEKVIKNLSDYVMASPAEAVMKFWKLIGAENIKNAVAFHNIAGNHIAEVMSGEKAKA